MPSDEVVLELFLLSVTRALNLGVIDRLRMYSLTSKSSGNTAWKMRPIELTDTLFN